MGKYAQEVCKQSELNLGKFGTISPQFSRKSSPNVENRQSRTGSNCGTLFCIQCSIDSKGSLPSCSSSQLKELGRFMPGRNAKWNRKFPEFPNFQKKGQPREVNRNFRHGKCLFHSILNQDFRKFWWNGTRPKCFALRSVLKTQSASLK